MRPLRGRDGRVDVAVDGPDFERRDAPLLGLVGLLFRLENAGVDDDVLAGEDRDGHELAVTEPEVIDVRRARVGEIDDFGRTDAVDLLEARRDVLQRHRHPVGWADDAVGGRDALVVKDAEAVDLGPSNFVGLSGVVKNSF